MKKFFLTLILLASFGVRAEVGVVAAVTLSPVGNFKAKTNDVKGEAIFKGDEVKAENIVVELKDLKTGLEMRDRHAKDKYLEVEKYPQAVLIKGEGKAGVGKGLLRLHGKEAEIKGTFEIKEKTLIAKFPIHLKDFGIEGINYKGVGVEDEVKVEITVPAKEGNLGPASASKIKR